MTDLDDTAAPDADGALARLRNPGRRSFLAGAGLMGAGTVVAMALGLGEDDDRIRRLDPDHPDLALLANTSPTQVFNVIRDVDSMVLTFSVYGGQFITSGNQTVIAPTDEDAGLLLAVDFTAQSVGEQSSVLNAPSTSSPTTYNTPATGGDANGWRARAFDNIQPTRLVFGIDGSFLSPSLTAGAYNLLSWSEYEPQLAPGIYSSTSYGPPTPTQTSIGAPSGLAMTPAQGCNWLHSQTPVTFNGRTELWHTRLAGTPAGADEGVYAEYPDAQVGAAAVWSNNFKLTEDVSTIVSDVGTNPNMLVPLLVGDRAELVRLMSDQTIAPYVPAPADVYRFMLSSGGAYVDLHGAWPVTPADGGTPIQPPAYIDDTSWTHRSTQGRDHEVVITAKGYLLPFGHPCTLVTRTVRRFESNGNKDKPVANLRTIQYIVIAQQDKFFDDPSTPYQPSGGRQLPFLRVRLDRRTTPNLTFTPVQNAEAAQPLAGVEFCLVDDVPYLFDVTAWDWEGNKVQFNVPMAFATGFGATNPVVENYPIASPRDLSTELGSAPLMMDGYNALGNTLSQESEQAYVTANLNGQRVALAPSSKPGDTTVRVEQMVFGLIGPPTGAPSTQTTYVAANQPCLYPVMRSAQALIPAVQTVSPGQPSTISFYGRDPNSSPSAVTETNNYIDGGFQGDAEVFLTVGNQALTFDSGGNGQHPGVVSPNLNVTGLARKLGSFGGDPVSFAEDSLNPQQYLSDAKVLGGLELSSIIQTGLDALQAPLIQTLRALQLTNGIPDPTKPPNLTTSLTWSPPVVTQPGDSPVFVANDSTTLQINAVVTQPGDGSAPTHDVYGALRNFTLNMFGDSSTYFLTLDFAEFSFHARNGAKPTVTPHITNVSFGGPLSFINTLEELLTAGTGSGNSVTITPTEVTASTSVSIPDVSIGIFSLTNMSFSGTIEIPFLDAPARVKFAFCSREQPFLISVLIFGGGGFFSVSLGTDGVEGLEVQLEFGAHAGIDIGIASGALEVMAGIYIALTTGNGGSQSTELTGFVKAHGELNCGPVGVSMTFYLSLTYIDDSGQKSVWGEVQVQLEIRVIFFSIDIGFTVRKEFGGGHDPSFSDMYDSQTWGNYVSAFA